MAVTTRSGWVGGTSFRTGGRQRDLGRWIVAAIATSVALHLALWKYASELGLPDYFSPTSTVEEKIPVDLRRAQINEEAATAPDPPEPPPVEREAPPPTTEPVDLTQFKDLKFEELRMTTEVQVPTNISASRNPAAGNPNANLSSLLAAVPTASSSESLSQQIKAATDRLAPDPKISTDQVVLPIKDDLSSSDSILTDSITAASRKGQQGKGDSDGFASLDDLLTYQGPMTEDRTAMMPTDLLFEYNSAELKDTARLSLMKLGFIIQKNPEAGISIEGHTDTFGGDEYNQRLSEARAEAVRNWLVESLRLDGSRLQTRGWGKRRLLVALGDVNAQQKNRRVEIVIRAKK